MAEQLILDYREAPLTPEDRTLCDYAIKLTLAPADVVAADVERLHEQGFNDEQVTLATQVIAYFNYINRIGDGLGVDPEPWMTTPTRDQWHTRRGRGYL